MRLLASSLLLTTLASVARAQSTSDSIAAVDAIFSSWSSATPGCAVGVSRAGKTIVSRAYGMANLEYDVPNTPATIFEGGSVSKQFTAAAVALLAIDGRLSLDDKIRKYFPELPPYGDSVTIRQMLNHTSGLRDWGTVAAAAGWPRGTRTYTHAHVLDIIKRQRALNYPPGSEYLYSNSNYNLAAMLVERVSGMTFSDFTRTRIFEPLGMSSTSWRDDYTRVVKHRATAYTAGRGGVFRQLMPFENVYGNSSLLTTVGDLLRWNENFVTHAVGGSRLARELQTRGRLTNGRTITYALGVVVDSLRGVPEVSHTGATAGYRAALNHYPDQQLGVALLCNTAAANPGALAERVAEIFLAGSLKPRATQAAAGAPLTQPELASRTGLYRNRRTNVPIEFVIRDGALALAEGNRFAALSSNVFVFNGARVEFLDDARSARYIVDGDTTLLSREPRWTPASVTLREFAGAYASDEAETWFTVDLRGDTLSTTDRYGERVALRPFYRDAFVATDGTLLLFRRARSGAITGVSLGLGRVRDLWFARKH